MSVVAMLCMPFLERISYQLNLQCFSRLSVGPVLHIHVRLRVRTLALLSGHHHQEILHSAWIRHHFRKLPLKQTVDGGRFSFYRYFISLHQYIYGSWKLTVAMPYKSPL